MKAVTVWWCCLLAGLATTSSADDVTVGYLSDTSSPAAAEELLQEALNNEGVRLLHRQLTGGPLAAAAAGCSLLDEGVSAIIIDSTTARDSAAISSLCEAHAMPCLLTRGHQTGRYDVALQPAKETLSKAVWSVLRELRWSSFTVLYDSFSNLGIAEDALADPQFAVRLIKIDNRTQIGAALQRAQQSGAQRLVLALRPHLLATVLARTGSHGLATARHHYLVPALDIQESRLQELAARGSTVTALRLVEEEDSGTAAGQGHQTIAETTRLVVAARALSAGLRQAGPMQQQSLLCSRQEIWRHGHSLLAVFTNQVTAAAGPAAGARLTVLHYTAQGVHPMAQWDSVDHTASHARAPRDALRSRRPALRVTAVLTDPYVMLKVDEDGQIATNLSGNDKYEGFCVDLIQEIAKRLGVKYDIQLSEDGRYGSLKPNTDRWNGMIGELADKKADVAMGDLSVTTKRDAAVDFTVPWQTFGISLLGYRSSEASYSPALFEFLAPFSMGIWVMLLVALAAITLVFFVVARLSPYERSCPPHDGSWAPYTFLNSAWFAVAAVFRQIAVQQPRAVSTRFLACLWWFFTLVVLATYIASLTAFLSHQPGAQQPVESLYDLPTQRKVSYGAIYEGSTWSFFRESRWEVFHRIYSNMVRDPDNIRMRSLDTAIDRVRKSEGTYAFLMEEPSIDYIVERDCILVRLGEGVGSRNHALAMQKGSPYLTQFNEVLRSMRQEQILQMLKTKWFKEKRGGGQCMHLDDEASGSSAKAEGVSTLCGAFLILLVGGIIAVVIAVVECCCKAGCDAKQKGNNFGSEMAQQLKQALAGPLPPTMPVTDGNTE